jgi:hypothetical protein
MRRNGTLGTLIKLIDPLHLFLAQFEIVHVGIISLMSV